MPSKSDKQHKFMEAVANFKKLHNKVKVKQSVGKKFVKADKKKGGKK